AEGEALARSGSWQGWEPEQLLGSSIAGATLGLVGFGNIGTAVAERARGFRLRVLYAARSRAPAAVEARCAARHVPLDDLLAAADFVSLHLPLTDETHHLIGARERAA